MKTFDILQILENTQKAVFTINDIAKIIKKPEKYSALVLYRLKKKGMLIKIEKNKYCLKDRNPYVIFSNIYYPSYISFLAAFSYYNLTSQIPKKVEIVSQKSRKEIKFDNYSLKFIKFSKKRFFGYKREKVSDGFIFIAEIEKAIIDALFLPRYCPIDETYNALNEAEINIEKLLEYSLKMKSKVVLKRLGYLLEFKKIDIYERLKDKINKKYDFLDNGVKKGERNKKWRLIINKRI